MPKFFFIKAQQVLLILIILLLPSQLAWHYWPTIGLLKGVRIDYLAIRIYLVDCLLALLGIISLGIFLAKKMPIRKVFTQSKLFICLFIFYILIQGFWNPFGYLQLYYGIRFCLWMGFFLAIQRLALNNYKLAVIFILQIWFLCLLSLAQFLKGQSIGGMLYYLGERYFTLSTPGIAKAWFLNQVWLRPYATFSHPNVLSAYLLLISAWLRFTPLTPRLEKIKFFSLIFGLVIILLAFSQTIWAAYLTIVLINHVDYSRLKKILGFRYFLPLFLSLVFFMPVLLLTLGVIYPIQAIAERNLVSIWFFSHYREIILGSCWFGYQAWITQLRQFKNFSLLLQPLHHGWWLAIYFVGLIPMALLVYFLKPLAWFKKISLKYMLIIGLILITGSFDHYYITQNQTLLLAVLMVALANKNFQNTAV